MAEVQVDLRALSPDQQELRRPVDAPTLAPNGASIRVRDGLVS
jgi:hypothetical protein